MTITDIEVFFTSGCGRCNRFAPPDCSARFWTCGRPALRRMAGAAGLIGARKRGQPCYRHAGRLVAVVGTFRSDFRLTFFNAALMGDPEGLLQGQGRNTRHADSLRFTDNTAALAMEPVIRACLT